MKDKRKLCWETFQQNQASSPIELTLVFPKWEKFLPVSEGELTEQLLVWFVLTQDELIGFLVFIAIYIMLFGGGH